MLQPIRAVRTADAALRVETGHRRTLAAVEAGLATVPVIVVADERTDDAGTIERLLRQYAGIERRAGLTSAERVGVVDQLALLKVSAAQIAKRTRMKRADVDHAIRPGPDARLTRPAAARDADMPRSRAASRGVDASWLSAVSASATSPSTRTHSWRPAPIRSAPSSPASRTLPPEPEPSVQHGPAGCTMKSCRTPMVRPARVSGRSGSPRSTRSGCWSRRSRCCTCSTHGSGRSNRSHGRFPWGWWSGSSWWPRRAFRCSGDDGVLPRCSCSSPARGSSDSCSSGRRLRSGSGSPSTRRSCTRPGARRSSVLRPPPPSWRRSCSSTSAATASSCRKRSPWSSPR